MPDTKVTKAKNVKKVESPSRVGGWFKYRSWTIVLHVLLLGFGLLNLYPFFWMVGTSLKEGEESSKERQTPFPATKYQLSDEFKAAPDKYVPDTLSKTQLQHLDVLQRRGRRRDVISAIGEKLMDRHEKLTKIRNEIAVAEKQFTELNQALTIAKGKLEKAQTRLTKLRDRASTQPADSAALQAEIERIEQSIPELKKEIAAIPTRMEAPTEALEELRASRAMLEGEIRRKAPEMLDRLVKHGLVKVDQQDQKVWLTETGANVHEYPPVITGDEKLQAVAEAVREYQAMTPEQYAKAVRVPIIDARPAQDEFVQMGLLERVPAAEENEPPRFRLVADARGPVYKGLLPRQIITLIEMKEENQRRHESRSTFAESRWRTVSYAEKYDLEGRGEDAEEAAAEKAEAELEEMVDEGYLAYGTLQTENYWVVLKEENFLLHFMTSFILTVAVVILTILLSSMLGYALARIKFPGKMLVLGLMIAGAVAPREATIIPIFKMLKAVDVLESLWGMIFWLSSFGVGNALLMAGFFLTLPKEVNEAAEVDGAGTFRTFFDIALPMARPIVMTVGLFAFLTAWNNFLIPLLCTVARPSMQPLAVAVYNFQRGHSGQWHQINAAASVMILPVIALFLLLQKHVVKSIAVGAVKG
ncbi:MAG: ABC transporter permease subunit [Phycisphaerae bacterium]